MMYKVAKHVAKIVENQKFFVANWKEEHELFPSEETEMEVAYHEAYLNEVEKIYQDAKVVNDDWEFYKDIKAMADTAYKLDFPQIKKQAIYDANKAVIQFMDDEY